VVVDGDLTARVVVGADGANSSVRRLLGAPANPDRALAIAVRGYAPAPPGRPEQLIAWVTDGWPAYVWSFPTGTGVANVGYGLLRSRFHGDRAELHRRLADLPPAARTDPDTPAAPPAPGPAPTRASPTSSPGPGPTRTACAPTPCQSRRSGRPPGPVGCC